MILLTVVILCNFTFPATSQPIGEGDSRVNSLLVSLGLEQYVPVFSEEEISLDILRYMSDENLRSVGIRTFGQRFRILQVFNHVSILELTIIFFVNTTFDKIHRHSNFDHNHPVT